MRRLLFLSLLLASGAALAAGGGWRHDGTAVFTGVTPPPSWNTVVPTWRTKLPAWGNASPVVVGQHVCGTSEPTWVWCARKDTGELVFQATNARVDTLPPAEQAAKRKELAEAEALDARIRDGMREMSRLRRDLRRPDQAEAARARLAEVSGELDALKQQYDALAAWLTPPELDMIGYASSTPTTDGRHVYAFTGNGVISSFTPTGERRWSVWLGEPVKPMLGYNFGSVASPRLLDGTLVVAHRHLTALDPATGAVRWRDDALWNHYGAPAVTTVGDVGVVLTPDGRVLRLSDGKELHDDLAEMYYVGPIVSGDTAYWIGGTGHEAKADDSKAWAWKLAPDGAGGVTVTKRWQRVMPDSERIYSQGVVHDGKLWVLNIDSTLWSFDAATGELLHTTPLRSAFGEMSAAYTPFGQPTIAAGQLYLTWENGLVAAISTDGTPALVAKHELPERTRATPWFEGDHVYMRTLDTLWRFDPR